jgi:hypothetical protein
VRTADALGPRLHLPARLALRRQVRECVRGDLVLLDRLPVELPALRHPRVQAFSCTLVQVTDGRDDDFHVASLASGLSRLPVERATG